MCDSSPNQNEPDFKRPHTDAHFLPHLPSRLVSMQACCNLVPQGDHMKLGGGGIQMKRCCLWVSWGLHWSYQPLLSHQQVQLEGCLILYDLIMGFPYIQFGSHIAG